MRLRDENKRRQIVATAAKLFSSQPYHKVRLDDVAADAGIGKGTVYIYFKSKEDLYYSLIAESFGELVGRVQSQLHSHPGHFETRLRLVIAALVEFSLQHPELFEVMRVVGVPAEKTPLDDKRKEMAGLINMVIREGVEQGQCVDTHPEWTSLYLPAIVRATILYQQAPIDGNALIDHIVHTITRGICHGKPVKESA